MKKHYPIKTFWLDVLVVVCLAITLAALILLSNLDKIKQDYSLQPLDTSYPQEVWEQVDDKADWPSFNSNHYIDNTHHFPAPTRRF